jgi:hypothetical protein
VNPRTVLLGLAVALTLGGMSAPSAQAAAPVRAGDSYTETFFDSFIYDLCGIETLTTVTERWTLKEFADGSAVLHVNREFIPADRRIPIERGAGTSFFAPDGTQTAVGRPTQLFSQDGRRLVLLDAGRVVFGEEITMRGHIESLGVDLAPFYCP